MTIHFKQLEDLIALAEHGSITAAARARNVTHPAFGRRIKALERSIETPLFVNTNHSKLQFSAAGDLLLQYAKQTLADFKELRLNAKNNSTLIRIATGRTLARTLLPDWLLLVQKSLNNPQFNVRTGSLHEAILLMENGAVDFVLGYEHRSLGIQFDARRYLKKRLGTDRLIPVRKPLLKPFKNPTATNLHKAPFIQYAQGLALRKVFTDEMQLRGLEIEMPSLTCDSPDAIAALVQKGLGYAWLPESLIAQDLSQQRLIQIMESGDPIEFAICIYRKRRKLESLAEAAWSATNSE